MSTTELWPQAIACDIACDSAVTVLVFLCQWSCYALTVLPLLRIVCQQNGHGTKGCACGCMTVCMTGSTSVSAHHGALMTVKIIHAHQKHRSAPSVYTTKDTAAGVVDGRPF